MKIGIFGGSFNPPHIAHCILAEYILDELSLDRFIFVPAAIPPHKEADSLLDAHIRLHLTQLAVSGNPRIAVSDTEIRRGGISYTVDTLEDLRSQHTGAELFLIMGVDNLIGLGSWKDYNRLFSLSTIIIMNRPGFDSQEINPDLLQRITMIDVPYLDISSTGIRKRLREKKSIKYLVSKAVEDEIVRKGYYM